MTKDVLNQEILVGDVVCLAVRSGNSAHLVVREVLEVEGRSVKVRPLGSNRSGWTVAENIVTTRNIVKKMEQTTSD